MIKMLLKKPFRTQQGFSIVEILIAITLGLILTTGIIQIFIQNKANVSLEQGMSRIQENVRIAYHYLYGTIQMAGFQGCSNSNAMTPLILAKNLTNITFNSAQIINGSHPTNATTWKPTLPTALTGKVKAGTDTITLLKGGSKGIFLENNMSSASDNLVLLENNLGIKENDLLLISDCQRIDLFRATSIVGTKNIGHSTSGNITDQFSKAYQIDARVMAFESITFYIKNTGRINQAGNTIFSLFQIDFNGNETELVEGVEDLQVSYGIDTNNDGAVDLYQSADLVEANSYWDKITHVQISILLNSIEPSELNPTPYQFNGITTTPTDKLRRQSFTLAINLRNRFL